jgi:hypothetical protein
MLRSIPDSAASDLIPLSKELIATQESAGTYSPDYRQTKLEAVEKLSERGYEHIGSGAGRLAATHPDWGDIAIKIAMHSSEFKAGFSAHGLTQNAQERRAWENLPHKLTTRFTPVFDLSTDGHLLLTRQVITDEDKIPYDEAKRFVDDTLNALYQNQWNAVQLTVSEVGLHNGDYIIYDYGLPVAPIQYILDNGEVLEQDYTRHPSERR